MNPRCSLPEKNPAGFSLRIVRDPEQAKTELQRLVQRTAQAQQGDAQGRVDTILSWPAPDLARCGVKNPPDFSQARSTLGSLPSN